MGSYIQNQSKFFFVCFTSGVCMWLGVSAEFRFILSACGFQPRVEIGVVLSWNVTENTESQVSKYNLL